MTESQFKKQVMSPVLPEDMEPVDGAFHIPIDKLEIRLDELDFSTRNFAYQIFKDGYANLCVSASLELEIKYKDKTKVLTRSFIGACNFSLKSIEPNSHFLATAKSMCIKNAASDIGKYYGRGLNADLAPAVRQVEKAIVKSRPDSKIMQRFLDAIESGDKATEIMLSNIYDIKMPEQEDGTYVEKE